MFHRHNWDLIDKTVIPPAIRAPGKWKTESLDSTEVFLDAMREKIIHVYKCECGKIKTVKN